MEVNPQTDKEEKKTHKKFLYFFLSLMFFSTFKTVEKHAEDKMLQALAAMLSIFMGARDSTRVLTLVHLAVLPSKAISLSPKMNFKISHLIRDKVGSISYC